MSLRCDYKKYTLHFKFSAGTSRGTLKEKSTYFIKIYSKQHPSCFGLGECGPLQGLSPDDHPDLETQLQQVCSLVESTAFPSDVDGVIKWLDEKVGAGWPAIRFGLETAALDFLHGGRRLILENTWSDPPYQPVPINGLIWMGDKDFMRRQIDEKLKAGFNCIKMKIGAIDFETERSLLAYIRSLYDAGTITLRVDANGAFSPGEALDKLQALSQYDIHSIEQPIQPGQIKALYELCRKSPVPIALDEELIGITEKAGKVKLLQQVQPQFIILKPTLLGGLAATREWISVAEQENIGWWITSALESNVGLNAIAQLAAALKVNLPQGLGTGQLYHNNIPSPMFIENGALGYKPHGRWNFDI